MSSTNKTEHYNLPQFIGSDIPTWLGDINSAMTAIDSGINAAATSASGAATNAAQALTDAAAAQNALNAKANTSTLATVETGTTASKAYAVGEYLVYNGILYRVTAAISSGQTLVPGANITATTAGAELTSLNNNLTSVNNDLTSLNNDLTSLNNDLTSLTVRMKNIPYSCNPGYQFNTNLKNIIDSDMPSGYKCLGIVGFTTSSTNVLPVSVRYSLSNYSFQLRSVQTAETVTETATVYYLCIKS